jgi:DNA polymerase I
MYDSLLYGKDQTERVVSVEPGEGSLRLFIQNEDGSVTSRDVPSKYWLLTNDDINKNSVRLNGDLHYKYGVQYSKKFEWIKAKQHLRQREIDYFSVNDLKSQMLINKGVTYFKGLTPKTVTILSCDLETTGMDFDRDDIILISNTFRDDHGNITKKLFCYDEYENPADFINDWCSWVVERDPSILIAHNGHCFDLPFLDRFARRHETEINIGRDGSALHFDKFELRKRKDGSQYIHFFKPNVYGREVIDTMFLAITWDALKTLVSYGLKPIISQLGLEKPGRVFYDASTIRHNYKIPEEWEKIKEYCIDDSDDGLAVFDYMSPPFFYLTQSVAKSFQSIIESASGSWINSIMLRAYVQSGHSIPKADEMDDFDGAISIGNPGIYTNVFKVDVASLYPSIILQYEVEDRDKDPKGYFLQMVKSFTDERLKNKKLAKTSEYYDHLQNAQKIFINSCYGFLGTSGLSFNCLAAADFITEKGREILTTAITFAESEGLRLVNADTDSISICKADGSSIDEHFKLDFLARLHNLYPERIRWEDDGEYLKVIVLRAKNYILWDGKKLKAKGSALKDAKKEPAIKELQTAIINEILNETFEYESVYSRYVQEALNVTDIKRWVSKKTYTEKIDSSDRENEAKVKRAIAGTDYRPGDKMYMYYNSDDQLVLVENYNNDYNKDRLLEKLFKSMKVFQNILPYKEMFPNYKLKKNQKLLSQFEKSESDGRQVQSL